MTTELSDLKAFAKKVAERARHDLEAHKFEDFCPRCAAEELLGCRPTKGLFT